MADGGEDDAAEADNDWNEFAAEKRRSKKMKKGAVEDDEAAMEDEGDN